jgi:phosphonoacetaldehyde hydrolase
LEAEDLKIMHPVKRIQLAIFDWAGTTIDFGCFAPVSAFAEAFGKSGIEVTVAEARTPMGLHKRDHIRTLLEMPRIAGLWERAYGRAWRESDVDALYDAFLPFQIAAAMRHTEFVPGLLDCVAELRRRGIRIGTTTGYAHAVADAVFDSARARGYAPDHNVCADDVPAGRPAPWMVYRNMEALGVFPPSAVVKVGDTVPDIEEGRNAGAWSVGVTRSSSDFGCTVGELAKLSASERTSREAAVSDRLHEAGAHAVIPSLAELPALIDQIETCMQRGELPG